MSEPARDPSSKDTHDTLPGGASAAADAVDAPPLRRSEALRRQRSGDWLTHPLTLLVATIVAICIVWMLVASAVRWRTQVVAERAAQVVRENERQAQQQAAQAQREAAEREAQRQAQLEQAEAAKAQAAADALRAQEEARVAELSAADRKEKAWAKFYRKPSHCETTGSMDCVNGYIRARRAFEEKWNKAEF
jgi:flagellar biosynthesis GTPase FlhF